METLNTLTLQKLVFGDRNAFVFLPGHTETETVKLNKVAKFLVKLDESDYGIDNPIELMRLTKGEFKQFKDEFFDMVESNSKSGFVLRKTFMDSEKLTEYTEEEWTAIFAEYAITYGWAKEYEGYFGDSPYNELNIYLDSIPGGEEELPVTGNKVFSIWGKTELKVLVKSILESSTVLRAQQIKTLEATPKDILADVAGTANIVIKETLVKVMTLLGGVKTSTPILKTSTDVLRFVVQALPQDPEGAIEGQLNKTVLKAARVRIPTRMRKSLLWNLEMVGEKRGAKYLTEDMFSYSDFWKRLDKYLRFTTSDKMRKRYPNYTESIDLLYEDDRSWTFNGRFSTAKTELDYDKAIRIAAERPGFLLRNLTEFLRMTEGTKLPVKVETYTPSNPLTDRLNGKTKTKGNTGSVILKDASEFLENDFKSTMKGNINSKLAWQLLENLENPEIYKSSRTRVVQGITINYSIPVPGVNKNLAKIVQKSLKSIIKDTQREKNKNLGMVYVDDTISGYKISYSGRKDTGVVYSGEFLAPGTSLSISEIMASKNILDPLLRLGVMWRGKPNGTSYDSVDIDHSLTIEGESDVFYGNPVLKRNSKVLISSSGDITSCGGLDSIFSTEIVDIDIDRCLEYGISNMVNSSNVFSGRRSMGSFEVYYFLQVIDRSDRVTGSNTIKVDLAKMDYACQVDPDNVDNTGAYIGFGIDLDGDKITALNIPIKQDGAYSNVRTNMGAYAEALVNMPDRYSVDYVVGKCFNKSQRTKNIHKADIIISRKTAEELGTDKTVIHPGRNMEELQKFFF